MKIYLRRKIYYLTYQKIWRFHDKILQSYDKIKKKKKYSYNNQEKYRAFYISHTKVFFFFWSKYRILDSIIFEKFQNRIISITAKTKLTWYDTF